MVIEHEVQTSLDELNRDKTPTGLMEENQNQNTPVSENVSLKNDTVQTGLIALIHEGQKVFIKNGQTVGRIIKLLPGAEGQVTYLTLRTAFFWGRNKVLPIEFVGEVNPKGVWLSIDRSKFQGLPDYKIDSSITAEVESALWNDEVLRATDYYEIKVRVKNGIVTLTGHITGMMNQERIEGAVGNVKGVLGVIMHMVLDDQLLLKVAGALVEINRIEGSLIFAKVENGVVVLSGKVISAEVRNLAEQSAAKVPQVRGVINNIGAPGIDPETVDQRFIQPTIGEKIFFHDSVSGFVKQVIINPNNRRVIDIIIEGQFFDSPLLTGSETTGEAPTTEQLVVIPVSVIRYLTSSSGFLFIDSTETTRYQNFVPQNFVIPDANWVPPYPYRTADVLFFVE